MANPTPATGFQKGRAKTGGKVKGSKNRSTKEREIVEQFKAVADENGLPRAKLAKDVLDQFMRTFAGYAAFYQPVPEGQAAPVNRKPNEEKFFAFADRAVNCAIALAKYQSPTYRAIMVADAPPKDPDENKTKRFSLTIFENGKSPRIIDQQKQKKTG